MQNKSILIIEDNYLAQKLMLALFNKKIYNITIANTGTQALSFLAKKAFSCIFIDLVLPDISGISIAKTIRKMQTQHKTAYELPIIALSAYVNKEIQNKCVEAKITALYAKPLTIETSKSIIKKYIS